ncbi:MAG: DUF2628 domain-containing protein [Gallionellaceae bacterium]
MYCSKCGVKNQDDSKFCGACGVSLESLIEAELPEQEIEDEDLGREIEIFVGPNYDYFEKKWLAAESHTNKYSWNWVAFLFPGSWLAYRKMYLYSALTITGSLALAALITLLPIKGNVTWLAEAWFTLHIGLSCNYWYKSHTEKKVDAIIDLDLTPEKTRDELIEQGGVSTSAAVIATVVYAVLGTVVALDIFSTDLGQKFLAKNSSDAQSAAAQTHITTGQTFQTKQLELKVASVKLLSAVGDLDLGQSRAPQGAVYVAVSWQYKNISHKPIGAFSLPQISLIDPNGAEYEADIGASAEYAMQVSSNEKILSDLNPGVTTTTNDVFEVSQELASRGGWRVLVKADRNVMVEINGPENTSTYTPKLPTKNASFDCNQARSTPELLICNDSELSALDNELAGIYRQAKSLAVDAQAFKQQTSAAWKWREANCNDKECLLSWYANRKSELLATTEN